MKLQDAFYAEMDAAGTWAKIGYAAPNGGTTTNFKYIEGELSVTCASGTYDKTKGYCVDSETKVASTGVSGNGWGAAANAQLNDCAKSDAAQWTVAVAMTDASKSTGDDGKTTYQGSTLTYTASVSPAGCEALTPNFANIGR